MSLTKSAEFCSMSSSSPFANPIAVAAPFANPIAVAAIDNTLPKTEGWGRGGDMVDVNNIQGQMSGQTPYVLQELIGIKNEIGNVKIWFGRLQASRLTKTRFLPILAI